MIKNRSNYVSSAEAASKLGFSHDYIRKLISIGKLKGEKLGHCWVIKLSDLIKIKRVRFPRQKEQNHEGTNN